LCATHVYAFSFESMRRISHLSAFALLLSSPAAAQARSQPIIITNVTVIDVASGTERPNQSVLIDGERIREVGPSSRVSVPRSARRLDGRGKFVIPGMWDMHVHALQSADIARQQRVFDLFLAHGVTGIRDMGSHSDTLRVIRAQVAESRFRLAPRIVAAGPLLDGPRFRWSQAVAWHVTNTDEARRAVDSLKALPVDFLKIYGSLSRDVFFAVAARAREVGLPLAGHVPLSITSAEAVEAGQISIEHNAMYLTDVCVDSASVRMNRALNRWTREGYTAWYSERLAYGEARNVSACRAHYARLRERNVHLVPTVVLELRDRRALTSPAFALLDSAERMACENTVKSIEATADSLRTHFFASFLNDLKEQHAAGVPLLAGSDLPNACLAPGASLHDELAALVQAGLAPHEALAAAITRPAAFLKTEDRHGRIAAGYLADLVMLDASPLRDINNVRRIHAVMTNGHVLERAELARLTAKGKP
jgi:imidazolonepropionase-like amidohydrolase